MNITSLEGDCFSEIGALSIFRFAVISKEQAYLYFQEVKNEFEGLEEIAGRYKNVHDIFRCIGEIVPYPIRRDSKIDRTKMPKLVSYLKEAQQEEEQAVQGLKFFLREILYNRHIDYYDVKKFI